MNLTLQGNGTCGHWTPPPRLVTDYLHYIYYHVYTFFW